MPTAGGTRLPPRSQENPTPQSTRLQLCGSDFGTHYQKPPFSGWREHKQHTPSPAPILPTPCHRPRPLEFLVRHPPKWLHVRANLASSEKCLHSEVTTWPPNHSLPRPSSPCHPAAELLSWPRPSQEGGAGVAHGSLKSTLRTLEHMAGARSTVRGLKGHHGSFHVLTLGKACTWQATSYSGSQSSFPGQPTLDGTALCDIWDLDVSQGVQVVTPCSPPPASPWQPCDFSKVSNLLLRPP